MPGARFADDEEDFEDDDDAPISLGGDDADWDGPDLGPDERDHDLMDGSWEERYYQGRHRTRDWNAIMAALGILVVLGLVLPAIVVFFR